MDEDGQAAKDGKPHRHNDRSLKLELERQCPDVTTPKNPLTNRDRKHGGEVETVRTRHENGKWTTDSV